MLDVYKTEKNYAASGAVSDTDRGSYNSFAFNKRKNFSDEVSALKANVSNRLLNALSDEEFVRILPFLQKITVSGGENIFHSGGFHEFVYFPETAVFTQLNVLEDGRTIETAMIGSEGIAGIGAVLSPQSPPRWTQTSIGGGAFRVSVEIFRREFNRGGSLQSAIFDYLNSYVAQLSQRVTCNNHHRIEERFSTWLLMLGERCGSDKLALTHDQISYFLGAHRPSITCVAQHLRDGGVIDYIRGKILILDRQKLKNLACECYSAICLV